MSGGSTKIISPNFSEKVNTSQYFLDVGRKKIRTLLGRGRAGGNNLDPSRRGGGQGFWRLIL